MSEAEEQKALWNGSAGEVWVKSQALLDRLLGPFEAAIFEAAELGPRVLDVGCGTGSTTIAAARRAAAVGIDISAPMLELARERAAKASVDATFILGDASTHAFEPASFDTIISRFGVMFFEDPVRAFENLRRTGGRLRLVAWRSAAENPFMTTAERAVGSLLPSLPPRRPGGPGQFAFGDRKHVVDILERSGWQSIEVEPLDRACTMPSAALMPYATTLGPVGRALRDADEATRASVTEKLRAAFDPFVAGDSESYNAPARRNTA
jgi:SAM-dependent methyltransferase